VGTPLAPGRVALRKLGGGSRYEVYLAWDDRLLALVVAKVLRPDHVEQERALRELRAELEILERIGHPVIVRSFGAVLDGPHPHLVLEHLGDMTLGRLIKRHGPLPMEQLLPLALHVTAALHYLAQERIVHLDVKPGNVVMGMPPRLIDLSIARSFERAAALRDAIGTDAYMAPEQCDPVSNAGRIGAPADVFGLGATLYHAISGKVAFPRPERGRRDDALELRFPQLTRDPVALERRIAPALRDLVMEMLARDPARRPAAAEVARALEPLVAALPRSFRVSRRGVRIV
jgi:serine/threonine protein kinase